MPNTAVTLLSQSMLTKLEQDLALPSGKTIAAGTTVLILPETTADCVLTSENESLAKAWATISRTGHRHAELSEAAEQMVEIAERLRNLDDAYPHTRVVELSEEILRLSERLTVIESGEFALEAGDTQAVLETLLASEANIRQAADSALSTHISSMPGRNNVSATSAPNLIPISDSAGKINPGWIPAEFASISKEQLALDQDKHDKAPDAHAAQFNKLVVGNFSPVIGICAVNGGGAQSLWLNIDADGQPISPTQAYFDNHPVYSSIRRVMVDGQVMQEHSKFYFKVFNIRRGPLQGMLGKLISPTKLDGFKAHPAFMKNGQEIDHWWCGTYQASDEGGSPRKIGSRPGKMPIASQTIANMRQFCQNRNENGVTGFDMWNIYQFASIQLLGLIEAGTPDLPEVYGYGHVNGSAPRAVDDPAVLSATWRGHTGLWGNANQFCLGLERSASGNILLWNNNGYQEFVDTGIFLPTNPGAYISDLYWENGPGFDFGEIFIPSSFASAANYLIQDLCWVDTGAGALSVGCNCSATRTEVGIFCFALKAASVAGLNFTTRLSKS